MSIIVPNQINPSNSNIANHINVDMNSIPVAPENS
ncbi:unnamed protein product, partial [Adineta steineri]